VQKKSTCSGVTRKTASFLKSGRLLGHVHGNAHGCLGGALAVTGLQHPELAFFDGKLNILHFPVMGLQFGGNPFAAPV
jgi:hypothetical protein